MRPAWVTLCAIALALVTGVAVAATGTSATEVDRAAAALGAQPPRRDEARAALDAALAAADDPDAMAQAHYLRGRMAEDDLAFADALAEDRAAVAAAPDSRWAVRASDRVDWLRSHAEGGFAPLAELERVRHDPVRANDPAAIDALARDADGFPPGMVRVEAWMFASEAWLGRMRRPDDAIAELRKVVGERRVEPLTLRLAEEELVEALASQGRVDEAVAEVDAHGPRFDPKFLNRIHRLRLRQKVRRGAEGTLVAFALAAVLALGRAVRRGAASRAAGAVRQLLPTLALFGGVVALLGGAIARSYESGTAGPFFLLAAGAAPVVLLSRAWSAVGSSAPLARAARAALGGGAALAATFLLLELVNPRYLDGFGL